MPALVALKEEFSPRIEQDIRYEGYLSAAKTDRELYALMRPLCRQDLYFLMVYVLGRKDVQHDWLFDRCIEVQSAPNGYLDLWAREHYKSTIITFGKTIQDIIVNPESVIGIFSHTRPIAKAFLAQIKREFETNILLQNLFPETFYENPKREAPGWSLDSGIIVKRSGNPKESTVEAHGLVDGQPTSRHFDIMVYDDVVTRESVYTPEMIDKTTEAWELSLNLGSKDGNRRTIGTRYHCLVGDVKITMGDWSEKNIARVKKGDKVVGWEKRNGKRYLIETTVTNTGFYLDQPVNKYIFESGESVLSTPDHRWWRGPHGSGDEYKMLGLNYHKMGKVRRLYYKIKKYDPFKRGWLSGFFDADGGMRKNTHHPSAVITFTQTIQYDNNINRLKQYLSDLGFEYSEYDRSTGLKNHSPCKAFAINGGWRERHRFFKIAQPAKDQALIKSFYSQLLTVEDRLVKIEPSGVRCVYWIETEVGNYIANRCCSKNSNDTYKTMMDRGSVIPRIYPATWNGKANGYPVFMTREKLAEKRRDMGLFTFGAQMLQDPTADQVQGFKEIWIKYWRPETLVNLTLYLLVDSAGSKKKKNNDWTVFCVIGLGSDGNYYLVDMIRDKLNLTERAKTLFYLHRKYNPTGTGYEEYGMQADVEYCEEKMQKENYRFVITRLGGQLPKEERIRRLIPYFETGRFFIPKDIIHENYENKQINITHAFIHEEFTSFPVSEHDDMLDCMARILDPMMNATLKPRQKQASALDEPADMKGFV